MSPAGSLLIAEIGGRKSSIGVLLPRLFSKGSRSTKKSNGFFFVVTSNLLNPAAMNVLFPAISALNHFSTVDPRRYVTADGRIDESHG